jgi:hypothetical protein
MLMMMIHISINMTTKATKLPSLAKANLSKEKKKSNIKNRKLNTKPMTSTPRY